MTLEKLLILTGDPSADIHAARVVEALQQTHTDLEITAVGGPFLQQTGITLLANQPNIGSFGQGLFKVFGVLAELKKKIMQHIQQHQPQVVLLVDYGVFHLKMAKAIKQHYPHIKVAYYIPPQLWASRPWRVKSIKKYVDEVFCVFPFEQAFYEKHGVNVTYVGSPVVETILSTVNRKEWLLKHQLPQDTQLIAILPGSRTGEVKSLLKPFLQAAVLTHQQLGQHPHHFVLVQAVNLNNEFWTTVLEECEEELSQLPITIIKGESHQLLALSQAALVASGTVSLESALYGVPAVVAYKVQPILLALMKPLILVKYFSLPNLILNQRVFPEMMNSQATPKALSEALLPFIYPTPLRQHVLHQLQGLKQQLGLDIPASQQVAQGLLGFLN